MDFSRMDIVRYLDDQHIPYRIAGEKNVKEGWIGVDCPFCISTRNGPDFGGHLGINLDSKVISCWRCNTKGPITRLIKEVEQVSYYQAENIASRYFNLEIKEGYIPKELRPPSSQLVLKPEFRRELMPVTRQYLQNRGFDPDYLIRKYDIMDGGNIGSFAWRVIIPIIMKGRIVSYTARTISPPEVEEIRYKMCKEEEALVPRNKLLYNIDTVSRGVIICEGPTDVWRIGDGSVATLGVMFSSAQIDLLHKRGITRAFILYDREAEENAERLAHSTRLFCKHVEVIYLDESKDPADLTPEEAMYLRRDLLGY
jgi:DNA primase